MQYTQHLAHEVTRVPGTVSSPRFARSRQMIECLQAEFLYTEKRARDILFREIEAIVSAASQPIPVARLIRSAAARASRRAARLNFEPPNWNIASRATIHAMLAAGVLLREDGSPIPVVRPPLGGRCSLASGLPRSNRSLPPRVPDSQTGRRHPPRPHRARARPISPIRRLRSH